MATTKERLTLYEEILSLIERKRVETGDDGLGAAIERMIVESQIQELQREIFEDPGAIEPFLEKMPGH